MDLPPQAKRAISELVRDLASGRLTTIVRDGRNGRLTAETLLRAVADYGRTLVDLPDEAWPLIEWYAVDDASFSVDVPMWTKEEGRSDLTLSLSIRIQDGAVRVSIDDLHVL